MRKIKTVAHVKRFIKQQVDALGIVWNPNVSHADYCTNYYSKFASGRPPIYTAKQAATLDLLVSQCHIVCEENGTNIFQLTLEALQYRFSHQLITVNKRKK
jgi:hypothetical protein